MPKVSPIQTDFTSGELSPLAQGRVDLNRYKAGLKKCKNYIPIVQGPLVRRSGSVYVAEVKNSFGIVRLIPFQYSTEQAYILEFGDLYIRFYKDHGQILSLGVPYELATLYADTELADIQFVQSADVMYLVHYNHPPRKLSRISDTNWTLTDINLLDGPYIKQNVTTTTLTPSATSGSGVTVTASAAAFYGNSNDIGRIVRIKNSTHWGYATITASASTTSVTVTVNETFDTTSATTEWRLGVYSPGNYPSTVCFHEDRLALGACPAFPQRTDLSNTSDYENFAPSDTLGVITANNAITFTLNSEDVDVIEWEKTDERGLVIGTASGEYLCTPSSQGEALSPSNVSVKRTSSVGSKSLQSVRANKSTLFVQRAGRKVIEASYSLSEDGFNPQDLTILSDHITIGGIQEIVFQKEPHPILWARREDGILLGMTFQKNIEGLRAGWHRHQLGGTVHVEPGIIYREPPKGRVTSMAVIPSPEGNSEELWLCVQRKINGTQKVYVEYFKTIFKDDDDQSDAFFVDSGLSLDNPVYILSVSLANPALVTTISPHGLSTGDKVIFYRVNETTEINGNRYTVTVLSPTTFTIPYDSSALPTAGFLGSMRKVVSSVSGLDHLEGETVSILGDGAVLVSQVVTGGAVTLSNPSALVHVGLPYESDAQLLRFEAGSLDGTSQGKTRRIHGIAMHLERTLGLKIGMDFDNLDEVVFRTSADPMNHAPELFSGIDYYRIQSDYNFDNEICIRQDQPLPGTILGVMPQQVTQDRS